MIYRINKTLFLGIACLFLSIQGKSQVDAAPTKVVVAGTIVDSKTGEGIAFANVFHFKTNQGTASNIDGFFRIPNLLLTDTITVSFVGYGKQYFSVETILKNKTISLVRKVESLQEFAVLSDNTYLYNLLARASKTQSFKAKTAKTYFELKTTIGKQQVELLECYFNGVFRGYDVDDLNLKNGRIALAEFNHNLFISTETSKALSFHKLIAGNEYFPKNPLELSKSRMKKQFKLTLLSTFSEEKNKPIYVIDFSPKNKVRSNFSGTIWVDSAEAKVIKIAMDITHADIYPIEALKFTDTLNHVNLHLTKNFIDIAGEMYVQSINFSYDMEYKNMHNEMYQVSTAALLTAYNYQTSFLLPFFTFESSEGHKDFKQITAVPYNDNFWKEITEFRINDMLDKNEFFKKHYSEEGQKELVSDNRGGVHVNMLYRGYVPWSKDRVMFKKNDFLIAPTHQTSTSVPSDFLKLEIQTYLDVNVFENKVHVLTQTLFDPFQSFYGFKKTVETQVFINIYFDLLEIERRKFEQEISATCDHCSEEDVIKRYQELLASNEELRKKYFRDVDRGNNTKQLKSWNDHVFDILGIDNLALFDSYELPMTE